MPNLPRVSDDAGKVALGIVALVEVPQVWSQWHPSVSTYRGGDWPDMHKSYIYASILAWIYSLMIAGLISWIIDAWWPFWGAVGMNVGSQFFYGYFESHPAPGNNRSGGPENAVNPDYNIWSRLASGQYVWDG
jgi:hypothetical protein